MKNLANREDHPSITPAVSGLTLTYSIADQNFKRTDSVGMLNLSVEMLEHLAIRQEIRRLDVLSNSSLQDRLRLPSSTSVHLQDATVSSTAGQIWWGLFGAYAKANKLGNDWLFLPKLTAYTESPFGL